MCASEVKRKNFFEYGPDPKVIKGATDISALPHDILKHVFSFLDGRSFKKIPPVCRHWNHITNEPCFFEKKLSTFGNGKWFELGINLSGFPPPELISCLNSPCPINPDKKVRETHQVIRMPETLDLEEFLNMTKESNFITFNTFFTDNDRLGRFVMSSQSAYWALVYMGPFPKTLGEYFDTMEKVLDVFNHEKNTNYKIPNLVETVVLLYAILNSRKGGCKNFSSKTNPDLQMNAALSPNALLLSSDASYENSAVKYFMGAYLKDSDDGGIRQLEILNCIDTKDPNWGVLGFRKF